MEDKAIEDSKKAKIYINKKRLLIYRLRRHIYDSDLAFLRKNDRYKIVTCNNKTLIKGTWFGDGDHTGHKIVCVYYGGKKMVNISIECEDCSEVIYSIDI